MDVIGPVASKEEFDVISFDDEEDNRPPIDLDNNNGSCKPSTTEPAKGGLRIGLDPGFIAELEAYQRLALDFDTEYSQFLSRPVPQCPPEPDTGTEGKSNNRHITFYNVHSTAFSVSNTVETGFWPHKLCRW